MTTTRESVDELRRLVTQPEEPADVEAYASRVLEVCLRDGVIEDGDPTRADADLKLAIAQAAVRMAPDGKALLVLPQLLHLHDMVHGCFHSNGIPTVVVWFPAIGAGLIAQTGVPGVPDRRTRVVRFRRREQRIKPSLN